jgi:hypothetical protein
MKNILFYSLFLSIFLFPPQLQAQRQLTVDNPVVQKVMKVTLQKYINEQTGENEKVKDIVFQHKPKKRNPDVTKLKGTVLFQNPKAALGNGDYRFKMEINTNLLKPKIHKLKLQVLRIWFIRFYKRVI